MGEIIKFPKPDPNRDEARLIREARAIYESVFPTEKSPAGVPQDTSAETRQPRGIGGLLKQPVPVVGKCAGFALEGTRLMGFVGAAGMTCRSALARPKSDR